VFASSSGASTSSSRQNGAGLSWKMANTERYAKLVSSMSKGTQFLFISHNKIAMEMAEQLIGVTMQEQGVSRIVAVDMESALSMADA
jgi:chromosome segregation protein